MERKDKFIEVQAFLIDAIGIKLTIGYKGTVDTFYHLVSEKEKGNYLKTYNDVKASFLILKVIYSELSKYFNIRGCKSEQTGYNFNYDYAKTTESKRGYLLGCVDADFLTLKQVETIYHDVVEVEALIKNTIGRDTMIRESAEKEAEYKVKEQGNIRQGNKEYMKEYRAKIKASKKITASETDPQAQKKDGL